MYLGGGLDHLAALVNGHGQGLLHVDVLARLAGLDRLDGVPVVGRGDDHGVDVLAVEHAAKVLVPGHLSGELLPHLRCPLANGVDHLLAHQGAVPGQVRLVDIAQSHDVHVILGHEALEQLAPAIAHADEADPDLLIGAADRVQGGRAEEIEAQRHAGRGGG